MLLTAAESTAAVGSSLGIVTSFVGAILALPLTSAQMHFVLTSQSDVGILAVALIACIRKMMQFNFYDFGI